MAMNPSRPFIERPVATSLLMLAILLAGLLAYRLLPLSALPEVDYPTIQVTTLYPGASRFSTRSWTLITGSDGEVTAIVITGASAGLTLL